MSKNPENPKTLEENARVDGDTSGGELASEKKRVKIKRMSRRIASLKKKSKRSKKAQDISPTKLDFEGENCRKEDANPEKEANLGGNGKEHSPTVSMSVFDRLGKKFTEHDLRHRLDTGAAHKGRAEWSQSDLNVRSRPGTHLLHLGQRAIFLYRDAIWFVECWGYISATSQ